MILCSSSFWNDFTPFGICVILPIAIVWMVMYTGRFYETKRTEVLLKAIESGKDIDANMIANAMSKPHKPQKSPREILNIRLTVGLVFTLISVIFEGCLIFGYFTFDFDKEFLLFSMFNSIPLGIGIAFLTVYFVTRKHVKD